MWCMRQKCNISHKIILILILIFLQIVQQTARKGLQEEPKREY